MLGDEEAFRNTFAPIIVLDGGGASVFDVREVTARHAQESGHAHDCRLLDLRRRREPVKFGTLFPFLHTSGH